MPSSPEEPLPVRTVSRHIHDWVGRLGRVWIEGQITQLTRRPGTNTVFLTLRDVAADVSLSLTMSRALFDTVEPAPAEGQRVVVHAKPDFYLNRGQLQLIVHEVRPVGLGALLARIEQVRRTLQVEGLFDADRKRALPFLPRAVGVICGRESAAKADVVQNASRRWPAVQLVVREVAVQGVDAVAQITDALRALDRDPAVEVIVITRGGGSVEDLLPFSDESLCRAVAAARTPVVSAIGHEGDSPLLDLVADWRASTPTDAAKRVVPDVAEESARVTRLRRAAWRSAWAYLDGETHRLAHLRSRPALAAPVAMLAERGGEVRVSRERATRAMAVGIERLDRDLAQSRAQLVALSPAATLERGYAIVRSGERVVRDAAEVAVGDGLDVRLARGRLRVTADKAELAPPS